MSTANVGDVLAGKYRIERVLGQGGMGVVVQATHLQLDERVAVKFLLPEYAQHPEASARFLREARAAVKIKSEHVARVIDVGTLDTGAPYMVMEFLQGRDLSEALQASGPLPIHAAVEHILQACEAIAEAHAAGIVHRDLKPANLFLTSRADGSPIVKVLDFGISKVTSSSASGPDMSLTKTSTMMGSPLYMSPEQMRSSRDVDPRSDIWSLGAILYELVTGQTPFTGETLPQVCTAILTDAPPSMRGLRADIPAELEKAVLRCLEKTPAQRYPSVAELAIALVPFSPKHGRTSAERISRVLNAAGMSKSVPSEEAFTATAARTAPGGTSGGTISPWGNTAKTRTVAPKDNRPLVLGSLAGVVVLSIGVATVLVLRSGADSGGNEPVAASPVSPPAAEPPAPAAAVAVPAASATATAAVVAAVPSVTASPAPSPEPSSSPPPKPIAKPKPAARPVSKPAPKPSAPPPPSPPRRGVDLFGDRK